MKICRLCVFMLVCMCMRRYVDVVFVFIYLRACGSVYLKLRRLCVYLCTHALVCVHVSVNVCYVCERACVGVSVTMCTWLLSVHMAC